MLEFKNLSWDDKSKYDKFYNSSPVHYAEYSFSALWLWQEAYPVKIAYDEINNLCWLKFHAESSGICGPVGNCEENFNLEHLKSENINFIYDMPEFCAEKLQNNDKFKLISEPDQDEYIYLVDELINLKGKKFAHKRNRVRTFLDGYEWDYYNLTPEYFDELINFQERWREHRDLNLNSDEVASLLDEDHAIKTALEKWNEFKFSGGIIKIENKIIAYTIAEELDDENINIKFEKAFSEYAGSYQAINNLFLRNSCTKYKYANREEDLGEAGLREAKISYNPVKMLKKYTVEIL